MIENININIDIDLLINTLVSIKSKILIINSK